MALDHESAAPNTNRIAAHQVVMSSVCRWPGSKPQALNGFPLDVGGISVGQNRRETRSDSGSGRLGAGL